MAITLPADGSTGWGTSVRAAITKANDLENTTDANTVHTTGNETVGGVKTFTSSPVVPTPTTATQVTPKGYVDTAVAAVAGSSGTSVAALSPLTGMPLFVYGHSYHDDTNYTTGTGAAGAYTSRIAAAKAMTVTKRSLGGIRMIHPTGDSTVKRVLAGSTAWVPNTRGLVTWCCTVNDVGGYGNSAAHIRSYGHAVRTFLAVTRSKAKVSAATAAWVYSAGWTASSTSAITATSRYETTTAGSYAEVNINGAAADLLLTLRSAANGVYTVTSDGTTVATVTDLNQTQGVDYTPAVIKLSGLGTGSHTIRITLTSGSWLGVDAVFIPSETPPPVVMIPEGQITNSSSNNTIMVNNYHPVLQTVTAEFPNAFYVSPEPTWDPTTMLMPDLLHPNDRGMSYLAATVLDALVGLSWSNGLNRLGDSPSYATPAAPSTPVGGQNGTGAGGVSSVPTIPTVSGLRAHYRADSITGLADAALVSALADSAAGTHALANANSVSQPSFQTAEVNGLPVLRYDGADDRLTSTTQVLPTTGTVFAVVKMAGTSGTRTIVGPFTGSGMPQLCVDTAGKPAVVKANTSIVGTAATALSTANFQVVCFVYASGSSWAIYLNGAADGSGSTSTTLDPGTDYHLGKRGTVESWNGDIAEVAVFDGVLSDTDRGTVTAYLGTKYGITVV